MPATLGSKVGGGMATLQERPNRDMPLRFSGESLELRDHLRDVFLEVIHDLAEQHAVNEGRSVVSADDFTAVLQPAIQKTIERVNNSRR
jgi:hypothetical protein